MSGSKLCAGQQNRRPSFLFEYSLYSLLLLQQYNDTRWILKNRHILSIKILFLNACCRLKLILAAKALEWRFLIAKVSNTRQKKRIISWKFFQKQVRNERKTKFL